MSKDKLISFKIEEEAKQSFEQYCKDNFTTPSSELYKYVHQKNKLSKSKRISLQDYSKRNK